jgi:RecA-family ATPase
VDDFDVKEALSALETEPGLEPVLKKVSLRNIEFTELPAPGGHGGAGKSILALIQAACYATSTPWFGFQTKGGRAVYVSLEDPAELLKYRLKKIIEAYDLPADIVEANLIILDGSDVDGTLCTETNEFGVRSISMTPLFTEVEGACRGAGFIVIDNASDAYGADENSRRQAIHSGIKVYRTGE